MEKSIGIVLSGGGVRGIAHVGLLRALRERNIKPHFIAGASAGALVGALYAQNYEYEDILDFFRSTPLFDFSRYSANKPGWLDSDKYRDFLIKYFPEDRFEELDRRLFVIASDLLNAEWEVFYSGELIRPLLASAAIPALFTPVEIDGRLFSDGGVMNNFPVEPLLPVCQKIIGSFVNPLRPMERDQLTTSLRVLQRAYDLSFYANSASKFSQCDYLFKPQVLHEYGMLDTRHLEEIFDIGYQKARDDMDHIIRALYDSGQQMSSRKSRDWSFSEN